MGRDEQKDRAVTERPPWRAFSAIFALALFVRLAYLAEMSGTVLFSVLLGDGAAFDAWARELADGNWRGDEVYYQAPLYPHLLGVLYLVTRDWMVVRVLQALTGAAACVLLADAARRLFDRRVGLLSGVLLALYAPAIYYEGLVQKTGLALFGLALLLHQLARCQDEPRSLRLFGAGVILGLLAVTRENLVVLCPVIVVWLGAHFHARRAGERARWMLAFLAGVLLVLAPVALRNRAVGGELVFGTTNFGPNLYIGNHAGADGLYAPLLPGRGNPGFERVDAKAIAEARAGRPLSASEVSAHWRDLAFGWMRAEPLACLALFARKIGYLFHDNEWMDSQSYTVYREASGVLRVLGGPMRFGVLAPLACVGLGFAWRRRKRLLLLYVSLPLLVASVAIFFVFGRFRLSLVPICLPFAACALLEIARRARAREWRRLAFPATVLAAAATLSNGKLAGNEYPHADTANNLGSALRELDRPDEALAAFRRAVRIRPDYASARFNLGQMLAEMGDIDAAIPHLSEAVRLEPAYLVDAHLSMAAARLAAGEAEIARTILVEARATDPSSADVHFQLGLALRRLGELGAAEGSYREALRLRPDYPEAHNNLGYLLDLQGRAREAAERYTEALRREPTYRQAAVNLAWLRASDPDPTLRDGAEALRLVEGLIDLHGPPSPDLLDLRAAALAESGRFDEAREVADLAEAAARAAGRPGLAEGIRTRRALYAAQRPFRSTRGVDGG